MGQEGSALSGDERAELERLRAENAALRAVVLGLTMALLVALALIEFLGRRPAET